MKTKVFNIWTEQVENFLHKVASNDAPYEKLSAWMDEDGAKAFQMVQHEHFTKHKAEYLEGDNKYPYRVRVDLQYEQLQYGFVKTFEKLVDAFPAANIKSNVDDFMVEALNEDHLTFIAAGTVIATKMLRSGEADPRKKLETVIHDFENLYGFCEKKIASMKDYLENMPKPNAAKLFQQPGEVSENARTGIKLTQPGC